MNENNQERNKINIKTLIIIIFVGLFVFGGSNAFPNSNKEAIKAAEDKMNQLVYIELGVAPQHFNSKVIYENEKKRIIVVKYGLTDTNWDGSACFYTNDKYVVNYSNIMGANYDYQGEIQNIRATFGI